MAGDRPSRRGIRSRPATTASVRPVFPKTPCSTSWATSWSAKRRSTRPRCRSSRSGRSVARLSGGRGFPAATAITRSSSISSRSSTPVPSPWPNGRRSWISQTRSSTSPARLRDSTSISAAPIRNRTMSTDPRSPPRSSDRPRWPVPSRLRRSWWTPSIGSGSTPSRSSWDERRTFTLAT